MFERFTDRARRVVVQAQEEARILNHNSIGTEHILLGLLYDDASVAARALEQSGVSRQAARDQVVETVGAGPEPPGGHIPFTSRAKTVLELSLREAMQLGHNYIGTEHILLGLIREGEGIGAQVLVRLGADLADVRQVVVSLLSGTRGEPQGTWTATQSDEPLGRLEREHAVRRNVSISWSGGAREPTCAFCGGDLWDLGYVVAGNGAVICEECVAAAGVAVADARSERLARDVPLHLPARISGAVPDEAAARAIQDAFMAVFGGRDPFEDFDDILEDAEVLTHSRSELQARVPQAVGAVTHVERIRFDAPDRARVRFVIMPGGMGAFRFEGDAIRRGDHWMVSRDTWCDVAARGGVQCPPRSE
jgi:Clp amino terminal domain, pathogenicity island component